MLMDFRKAASITLTNLIYGSGSSSGSGGGKNNRGGADRFR